MRVIVSHQPWPARPRGPVRVDQRLRVDLEVGFGCRMGVGGWQMGGDGIGIAKQQAAAFVRKSGACFGQESFGYR